MTKFTRAVGASFLIVGAFCAAPAFAAEASADVAAMQAVDQTWLKSYNGGDADTIANLYDEHAILMPPGAPAQKGRAAIHTFLAADIAASKKAGVEFHLGANPDGGVNGDLGWVSGTYSVTDKSGKVVESGKYLSVSKKEGGKWHYVRDTWNADGAAPEAAKP
jgi:ketosteroid isomerase-like protein